MVQALASPRRSPLGWLACALLLQACATSSWQAGGEAPSTLRLDSVNATRTTNPPLFKVLTQEGTATAATTTAAATAPQAAAVTLVRLAPVVLTFIQSDEPDADKLLQRELVQCAIEADEWVNRKYFGEKGPRPEDCNKAADLVLDGCQEKTLLKHLLGREKHERALACAQNVLKKWWRGYSSIEQRYRYYPNAKFIEAVSAEEEARLRAQGCTNALKRTIKPDLVLHEQPFQVTCSVLTVDFKFPCKNPAADPFWTGYGDDSAYSGKTQGQVYKEALGGDTIMVSPTGVYR